MNRLIGILWMILLLFYYCIISFSTSKFVYALICVVYLFIYRTNFANGGSHTHSDLNHIQCFLEYLTIIIIIMIKILLLYLLAFLFYFFIFLVEFCRFCCCFGCKIIINKNNRQKYNKLNIIAKSKKSIYLKEKI